MILSLAEVMICTITLALGYLIISFRSLGVSIFLLPTDILLPEVDRLAHLIFVVDYINI